MRSFYVQVFFVFSGTEGRRRFFQAPGKKATQGRYATIESITSV